MMKAGTKNKLKATSTAVVNASAGRTLPALGWDDAMLSYINRASNPGARLAQFAFCVPGLAGLAELPKVTAVTLPVTGMDSNIFKSWYLSRS